MKFVLKEIEFLDHLKNSKLVFLIIFIIFYIKMKLKEIILKKFISKCKILDFVKGLVKLIKTRFSVKIVKLK